MAPKRQFPAGKVTEASVYRCADCGHGQQLWAWAPANAYGRLAADGDLETHDSVWDDGIHEDSIQCSAHPDGVIEKSVDGRWCRWWNCPKCNGAGRVHIGDSWKAPDGYECNQGLSVPGKHGPYTIHRGWRPVEALAEEVS